MLDLLVGERPVAGDEVAEDCVVRLADRGVERRRGTGGGPHLAGLRNRQVGLVGDLLERRLAAEHGPERALRAVHLLQPLDDVDGHPDRPCLVGKRPGDRLADPPGGVGRELVAAAPVELLDGADQAERPFLDQVEERQALVAVVLGDRDDQAEVRLDHPLLRLRVAGLDLLRQLDLLGSGQERMPAGLAQEELERVGGRLPGDLERRRLRRRAPAARVVLAEVVDDVDLARLELAMDGVDLERVEPERLEHVVQLRLQQRAAFLRRVDELPQILAQERGCPSRWPPRDGS